MSIIGQIQQQSFLRHCFTVRCLQFSSLIFNYEQHSRYCSSSKSSNPLINIDKLPQYTSIDGESVNEAIPLLVKNAQRDFNNFEERLKNARNYTWDNVINDSEQIFDPLSLAWKAVFHLQMVKNNPSLRKAYEEVQPEVVALTNKVAQSLPVYHALQELNAKRNTLQEAQQRILTSALRSAKHSGVHLKGALKEEFNNITQELAELSTKFSNNKLDSTKSFSYLIRDIKDLDGLPASLRLLMAVSAGQELNQTTDADVGPWKLSLDMPCFEPFMKYSTNSSLRKMLYKAYISLASSDQTSNSDIIERIRQLRRRKSAILGFNTHAELSLTSKMAKSSSAVWSMINKLSVKAKPKALQELNVLREYASTEGFEGELHQWDLSFWAEKHKEKLLDLNEEKLREYFPLPRVLNGLFALSQELFGIRIEEDVRSEVNVWDEGVKFFHIYDSNTGSQLASFFLDLYSRPGEKQGGAWMESALDRNDALGRQPIAYLVCNQSPPVGDTPSLMTFREVKTLFHEFGHGLQHMLTKVKYPSAAGTNNIEHDAVELPSQFMENWLYDWKTVSGMTSHYKTGASLPAKIFAQLQKAKYYSAAMATMRQLYFSALDMELHTSDDHWREVMTRVAGEYSLMTPLPEDHFPCSFLHIFAGGYDAGYYSYKWAEVLSADAFEAFEEKGLDNREELVKLGKRFRDTILSLGGSQHPEEVFVKFRGKKPNVDPLLKSYGLL